MNVSIFLVKETHCNRVQEFSVPHRTKKKFIVRVKKKKKNVRKTK